MGFFLKNTAAWARRRGAAVVLLALFFPARELAAKDIQGTIAEKKAAHEKLLKEAQTINLEIDNLKSKLISRAKNLRSAEENLTALEGNIQKLHDEKALCIEQIYRNQDSYGGMIGAARKYSASSTPEILLQSTPLNAARASLVMKSLIPRLTQHAVDLQRRLSNIEKIEDQIAAKQEESRKELEHISEEKERFEEALKERRTIYSQTESERKQQEADMVKLANQAKNLEDLVARLKSKATALLSKRPSPAGSLAPVSGVVRTGFGQKDDLGVTSKGITFTVRNGSAVVTPLAGTVKFAGAFQTYRQILIIEHGGGYHSLIAGLGRIDTVVGAALAAGEPVGIAENSDSAARVYYELRQNGEPINPRKILLPPSKTG